MGGIMTFEVKLSQYRRETETAMQEAKDIYKYIALENLRLKYTGCRRTE